jgi:hypothetical protein
MEKITKQEIEALLNLALSKDPDNWLLFKLYPIEARKRAFAMLKSRKLETLQIRDDGYYEFYLGLGMSFMIDWIDDRWFDDYYNAALIIRTQTFREDTFDEKSYSKWMLKNIYQEIKNQYTA